jgi:hypothetical protein
MSVALLAEREAWPNFASILVVNMDEGNAPRTLACAEALAEVLDFNLEAIDRGNNESFSAFVGDPLASHPRSLTAN